MASQSNAGPVSGNIDETINLVGISSFISSDGTSADVREIERSLVEQTEQLTLRDVDEDVVAEFKKRISSMESAVGISLNEPEDEEDEDGDDQQPYTPPPAQTMYGYAQSNYGQPQQRSAKSVRFGESHSQYQSQFRHSDPGLVNMSNEQRRQQILSNALSNINMHSMNDDDKFNLDQEKENDTKNLLLEQINMLRTNLTDDEIKIDDVRIVNSENTLDEVERVFEQLRYRNDHARYCSFAKELAEVGAYGIEWAFDGKKNYFGLQPDLTGWGATLNIKMRRLRYETSQLVSDGMASYNLGNFSRLCFELIPSMIIHARMRKNGGGAKDRPSDSEVAKAVDKIRDSQQSKRDK